MRILLAYSAAVDRFNTWIGWLANWLVLFSCLISAGNAFSRYLFNASSNAWLEIQWYMFGAMFLLGASYTLNRNEHVRVDLVYGGVSTRTQIWIDLIGGILFLLPATIIIGWLSWPMFVNSYQISEVSTNAGGLIRWPVKVCLPIGFLLLTLQGLSEIIKRIAALQGHPELLVKYEKPLQ
ncbi:MAG: TRAP transporter small permease subunit [Ferrovibrio sp.]|nr:TRAP transporter small permease subunit [Ferrovibrio sp.]